MSNNDIKIEDIQYGLVLGSDINTVKEALWMTWRAWVEVYQKKAAIKPSWTNVYYGECPCCEYVGELFAEECNDCPMLALWHLQNKDMEDYTGPCVEDTSSYGSWELYGDEYDAKIIADFALDLLKKKCYGIKEMAGPQKPDESV